MICCYFQIFTQRFEIFAAVPRWPQWRSRHLREGGFAFVFAPTKSELEEMRYTYFACYFECVCVVCVFFYVTDNCIRVSLCLLCPL